MNAVNCPLKTSFYEDFFEAFFKVFFLGEVVAFCFIGLPQHQRVVREIPVLLITTSLLQGIHTSF